ncbi:MAG: lipoprotein-releasing ABC transporter permease subunit [Gammaproteobacteria bacterium]|nr:lipoprotein-releasing ABC transporter permease subunit [Gammaproteobacteria bacterium]
MSKSGSFWLARYIATRYISVGRRSQLVSFMSAVSIFGLALGVTILITVLSVMNGFDREVRENILGIVPHITLSTEENFNLQRWQQLEQQILERPDVQAVAPLIEQTGIVSTDQFNKGVLVNGIDPQREQSISVLSQFMVAGSLAGLANERWGVVIGQSLANNLGVGVGDKLDLFSLAVNVNPLTPLPSYRAFSVVGIYRVGTLELDSELAVVNIDAARALFKLRNPYTGLRIRLQDVLTADQVRLELQPLVPAEMRVTTWTQVFGSIYENILFSRTIVGLMLWLLVAVAAFNLVVSLIMVVRDKRSDIAILRTMGASPHTIRSIFMLQGFMVGVIGTGIGLVLGVLAALGVGDLAELIEQGFGVQLLNAEVYPIDFLPSEIKLSDIAGISVGVMLLAVLATVYPSRRAASIQPAEALRTE